MNNSKSHIISNVTENSPAHKAGIKAGDVLVSINGENVEDVFDYRYGILVPHLEILVKRNDEEVVFSIDKD